MLPQPEDRLAKQAFRRAYLSREAPDPFAVPDAMRDSRQFHELVGRLKAVSYAGHPAAATGALPITVDAGAAALLTERLIACIARFEPAKGDRFTALDRTGLIRLALGALATTAIPNLADDDVASLEAVDSCLATLRAKGLSTLDARVSLLRLRPEGRDAVEAEIDRHLRSHRIERVEAALDAMLRWAVFGRAWRVPGPPKHLQGSVFLLVADGWPPVLRQALDTAVSILAQGSGTSDLPSVRDLLDGLDVLRTSASYARAGSDEDRVPVAELPGVRAAAAKLAAALADAGYGKERAVEEWIRAALDDPLPEVRHAVVGREASPATTQGAVQDTP